MPNPFRQLLKRWIDSPDDAGETPLAAPDSAEDGTAISAPIAFEDASTKSEAVDSEQRASTEITAQPNTAVAPLLETPELEDRTSNPRSEPLPADVPWDESAGLDNTAPEVSDVAEPEAHSFSVLLDNARWNDAGIHSDIYYYPKKRPGPREGIPQPLLSHSPGATRPRLADDRPRRPSFFHPNEATGDETPAGINRAASPHGDPALTARIMRTLDLFDQSKQTEDPDRMLIRLESLLQRFVTLQQDLSRYAERLDQLETAHFLRGRL